MTARRFWPGAADFVFLLILAVVLIGGRSTLLNDPGSFWHLRLGRDIWKSGDVTHVDSLTYSRSGIPWVDQSWLFDLALAKIVDFAGWSGAVAATALVLAWICACLTRAMIRADAKPWVALCVAMIVAEIGSIHFLVRPHIMTFAFVLWTLGACRDYHLRGSASRRLTWAPIAVAVWANLHGGFLAGPLIVLSALIGHAIAGPWDDERRRRVLGFSRCFALCSIAPMANPYGFDLYRHVFNLLHGSGVTALITEYQPPAFGKPETRMLECVILGLIAIPAVVARKIDRYELVHVIAWLHLALTSVRQAPLFGLAAAPAAALLAGGRSGYDEAGRDSAARFSVWPAVVSIGVVIAASAGVKLGGHDRAAWPFAGLAKLDAAAVGERLFHEQDWGGMIESECKPARKAWIDDRFELFGKAFILDYVGVLEGGPTWDDVSARERFDLVWIKPSRPLARRLKRDRSWRVVYEDKTSILFRRRSPGAPLDDSTSKNALCHDSLISYHPVLVDFGSFGSARGCFNRGGRDGFGSACAGRPSD